MLHAVECGKALNDIRQKLHIYNKGGWKNWIKHKFDGSYETAHDYCRVAKAWDTDKVESLKKQGKATSIRSVLKVLRQQDKQDQSAASTLRKDIRKQFNELLQALCLEELESFNAELWQIIYNLVYDTACKKYEFDINEYLLETGKLDEPAKPPSGKKSRSQLVKEAERGAKKDMLPVNPEKRKERVEEMNKRQKEISERVRKAMNKKTPKGNRSELKPVGHK